jgi:hypothetical protein
VRERRGERTSFDTSKEYYSPYRPPGKAPAGFEWECVWRHPDKGYPERWCLRPTSGSKPPSIDELPPAGLEGVPLSRSRSGNNRRESGWFPTFIELSQTKHDKDEED